VKIPAKIENPLKAIELLGGRENISQKVFNNLKQCPNIKIYN